MAVQLSIPQKELAVSSMQFLVYKVLMSLQPFPEINKICIGDVSEFDDRDVGIVAL